MRVPVTPQDIPARFTKVAKYIGRHWPGHTLKLDQSREYLAKIFGYGSYFELSKVAVNTALPKPYVEESKLLFSLSTRAQDKLSIQAIDAFTLLQHAPLRELSFFAHNSAKSLETSPYSLSEMGFSDEQASTLSRLTAHTPSRLLLSGGVASGKATFARILSASMKGAYKDLWLGEIHSSEELKALKDRSADSGSWFATVHADSAINTIRRLLHSPYSEDCKEVLCDSGAIVSLSLVPSLCSHCSTFQAQTTEHDYSSILLDRNSYLSQLCSTADLHVKAARPEGCPICNDRNFSRQLSRTFLCELIEPTPSLLSFAKSGDIEAANHYLRTLYRFETHADCSGETKVIHGLRHLLNGKISLESFNRCVIPLVELDEFLEKLETDTWAALNARNIMLEAFGGFNVVTLITNPKAIYEWRKEYHKQS